MPSQITPESSSASSIALDIVFPEPSAPLKDSHLSGKISWAEYMDEISWHLERYLRDHDSPEERLRTKNPERFAL